MNKLMTLMATVALVLAGRADQMTYAPQGGDNLWSDTSAWRIDGAAVGRVPTDADDVMVADPALDAANPLTVAADTSATAGTFALSNASSSATSPLTLRLAENATLSASGGTSYVGARSSMGPVALIQEPGSALSVSEMLMGWNGGCDSVWDIAAGARVDVSGMTYIGRTDNAYCFVTNRGVFTSGGMYIGAYNGSVVDFENYGVITNAGSFRICFSHSTGKHLNRAKFHIHPGASLVAKNGDFHIGSDGQGELIVDGGLYLDTAIQINLGNQDVTYNYKYEDVKHPVGTLRVRGNGLVTTNLKNNATMHAGHGKWASGHVVLTDNGRIVLPGDPNKPFTFGYGEESIGTLTLSNNASFEITKNIGMQFASGKSAQGRLVMADQTEVSVPTDCRFANGESSVAEVALSGSAVFTTSGGSHTMAAGDGASVKAVLADSSRMELKSGLAIGAGAGSSADIRLRGGTIALGAHNTRRSLTLGTAESSVRMSGWGSLGSFGTTAYTEARSFILNLCGLVVADGEGQSRTLDFNIYGSVNGTNEVSVLNACGTNGWYAVNGGCLALPCYRAIDATTHCVGDFRGLSRPNVVNAFTVALAGAATGKYLHGSLYAPEHEDVPAGLPAEKYLRPIGIWRIGYGDAKGAVAPGKAVAFTSADVTVKIGLANTTVKPKRKVTIRPWRYVNDTWVGGEMTEFDPENPYVTFANVEPCVTAGTTGWNLGWFAVTADDSSGLILLLK